MGPDMAKNRNALKSGIFIFVTVAAIIAVIVAIKGITGLGEPMDRRAVAFSLKDDLGGLQVGDDIRVGGYKVGVIESIKVVGADTKAGPIADAEPVHILVEYTFPRK